MKNSWQINFLKVTGMKEEDTIMELCTNHISFVFYLLGRTPILRLHKDNYHNFSVYQLLESTSFVIPSFHIFQHGFDPGVVLFIFFLIDISNLQLRFVRRYHGTDKG